MSIQADETITFEVVPASHQAEVRCDIEDWQTEWIASNLGVAITTEVLRPERFEIRGLVHIWSLRTAKIIRTIEVPAQVHMIVGDHKSPWVVIAGGPSGKYFGSPFVWRLDVVTGEVTNRFLIWQADDQGAYHYSRAIVEGAISLDRNKLFIKLREGFIYYNLADSEIPPTALEESEWETQADKDRLPPSALPNWLLKVGASDGYLTINENSEGVAVWRNDTWELVLRLGFSPSPIILWIPSPNGEVVLGMRAYKEAHLIWDLKKLNALDWIEPNLMWWCEPAFTDDGVFLRFARRSFNRTVEFVSRDWRKGEDRIEYSTQLPENAYFRGPRSNEGIMAYYNFSDYDLSAEFSEDGRSLVIANQLGSTAIALSSQSEPTSIVDLGLCIGQVAGITADQKFIYYWPPISREKLEYDTILEWDVENKKAVEVANCEVSHPPSVSFAEHPKIAGQALAFRASGASMGPYGFNLWTRRLRGTSWRAWPQEELKSLSGSSFVRSANGRTFLLVWFDHSACSFDPETGKKLATFARNDLWPVRGMQRRVAAPLGGKLFLSLKNGGAQILKVTNEGTLQEVIQLWSTAVGSWLAVLPDGRYFASPVATLPVFFRRGGKIYPVEDYDLHWNRPAEIARVLDATEETVQILEKRQQKRIQRVGAKRFVSEADGGPSLTIEYPPSCIHDTANLGIQLYLAAGDNPISTIDLYVNDVPVYGHGGYSVDILARTRKALEIVTPLTIGSNKIQIIATDSSLAMSDRLLLSMHRTRVGTRPTRFVVSIGVSDYGDPDLNLAYAAKDANDIAAAMKAAGNNCRDTRILILSDAKASKKRILDSKHFFSESSPEDEVIIFVAGHGIVDDKGEYYFCPHDFELDDFKQGVSFTDLESLFDGIPALNRLLLVDTCHSGELTEEEADSIATKNSGSFSKKGVRIRKIQGHGNRTRKKNLSKSTDAAFDLFLDLRRTTGATIITASGALEFAYEDSERKNGLFTHSILEVINATIAGHKEILRASTLADLVASKVEAMTAGLQNPRVRFVNLTTDFPVVVSNELVPTNGAQNVVIQYLKWSSLANKSLHPRQMTCFAPEVIYYGKLITLDQVSQEEQAYGERFRLRYNTIKRVELDPRDENGIFRVVAEFEFDHTTDMNASEADEILKRIADGENTGWLDDGGYVSDKEGHVTQRRLKRVGVKTIEAFVREFGHEWKIVRIELIDMKWGYGANR